MQILQIVSRSMKVQISKFKRTDIENEVFYNPDHFPADTEYEVFYNHKFFKN